MTMDYNTGKFGYGWLMGVTSTILLSQKQTITSQNTSVNTISKIYSNVTFPYGSVILDYGCGKYDTAINHMASVGCAVLPYDKYNRPEDVNERSLNSAFDYIVCSNVLNVLESEELIHSVLSHIQSLMNGSSVLYVSVYEGDRSGCGKETSKGFQQNQKSEWYKRLLENYFKTESLKNKIFRCTL